MYPNLSATLVWNFKNIYSKMWDVKNRVQKSGSGLLFYSKREEAAWPFLFFPPHILDPIFSCSQTNACFQNKNSVCKLTGQFGLIFTICLWNKNIDLQHNLWPKHDLRCGAATCGGAMCRSKLGCAYGTHFAHWTSYVVGGFSPKKVK